MRKLSFKAFNLSKHLIKNLQMIINILTDKEDNEEEGDTEKIPEPSTQKQLSEHSFPGRFSKPNKGKEKDTRDQSSIRRIPPSDRGGDSDDDNNSSEEENLNRKKLWHPKLCQKINIQTEDNAQE